MILLEKQGLRGQKQTLFIAYLHKQLRRCAKSGGEATVLEVFEYV